MSNRKKSDLYAARMNVRKARREERFKRADARAKARKVVANFRREEAKETSRIIVPKKKKYQVTMEINL